MRVRSFGLGLLLATAFSLVSAGPCKPATSASSSSVASSSSSAAPTPLPTFNIVSANSPNSGANGYLLEVQYDDIAEFNPSTLYGQFQVEPLTLEAGTNYLMAGAQYLTFRADNGGVYVMSQSDINYYGPSNYPKILCSAVYAGVPLSCAPVGYPDTVEFYVYESLEGDIYIRMYDPNSVDFGYVPVDLVPQAV